MGGDGKGTHWKPRRPGKTEAVLERGLLASEECGYLDELLCPLAQVNRDVPVQMAQEAVVVLVGMGNEYSVNRGVNRPGFTGDSVA